MNRTVKEGWSLGPLHVKVFLICMAIFMLFFGAGSLAAGKNHGVLLLIGAIPTLYLWLYELGERGKI